MTTHYRGQHRSTDQMLGRFRDERVREKCPCDVCTYVGQHRSDLVVTRYTGHGLSHGTYRRDVRVHPVLQSDHLEIAALKGLRSLRVDDPFDRASR